MAGPDGGPGSRWIGAGASGIATGSAARWTLGAGADDVKAGAIGEGMPDAAGTGNVPGIEAAEPFVGEDGPRPKLGSYDLSTESVRAAWGAAAVTRTRSRGAGAP